LIREQQLRGFIVECAVVDEQFDPELAFICFLKGNLPFGSIPPVRLELQGEGFGFFEPFELFAEREPTIPAGGLIRDCLWQCSISSPV